MEFLVATYYADTIYLEGSFLHNNRCNNIPSSAPILALPNYQSWLRRATTHYENAISSPVREQQLNGRTIRLQYVGCCKSSVPETVQAQWCLKVVHLVDNKKNRRH